MNYEVIAKDKNGVKRCYGLGKDEHQALVECKRAVLKYFQERPDITELYLYCGDSDRPFIDAKSNQTMVVKP